MRQKSTLIWTIVSIFSIISKFSKLKVEMKDFYLIIPTALLSKWYYEISCGLRFECEVIWFLFQFFRNKLKICEVRNAMLKIQANWLSTVTLPAASNLVNDLRFLHLISLQINASSELKKCSILKISSSHCLVNDSFRWMSLSSILAYHRFFLL